MAEFMDTKVMSAYFISFSLTKHRGITVSEGIAEICKWPVGRDLRIVVAKVDHHHR
jgi:hypothetical protein